jgi:crotonobetainyl-CoA:carnitine CoA-transferase CaiB-like acyl-CoA transferase
MYQLLKGIRVLDLTTIVLGPYAGQMLGDLGAEVIKIEPPGGDLFRAVRPGRSPRMGAGYLNLNRNKKSVVIDLKTAAGQAAFRKLAGNADVLIHNMRVKSAAKLGLDYETVKGINPEIVYCLAPGFGQGGRNADKPAYDDIIQVASGLAALNADADGAPRFLSTIVCDKVGGLHLTVAALAGIAHKERTGKGCKIEAPMFESMVSFLMTEQLSGMSFEPPLGSTGYERLMSPDRRPFPTRDGYLGVLPYSGAHWSRFLKFIGRDDLASADWVQDPVRRSERVGELYGVVAEAMATKTTAEWLAALKELDIPCAPVNELGDLIEEGHATDVGLFVEFDHPSEGRLRGVRTPFTVTGVEEAPDLPAPELGEHTEALIGKG